MTIPTSKKQVDPAIAARPRGRPKAFDREVALDRAMLTFWRFGYQGASMPVLTQAMGISAQSLYATFQSKAELYREALERYRQTANFAARAYEEESDIWQVFHRILYDAAEHFTRPDDPSGCMLSLELLQFPAENASLAEMVQQMRAESLLAAEKRIRKAMKDDQLAGGTDATALARLFYGSVLGMAIQARDGASRGNLEDLAAITLSSLRRFEAA